MTELSPIRGGKPILIVDDDISYLHVLELALESWGYSVQVAMDGEEALKLFMDQAPALVITDLTMPKLDGIALLRTMKKLNPKTRVILLTGHKSIDTAVSAMESGAVDFLTKPVDYLRLKSRVERSLGAADF